MLFIKHLLFIALLHYILLQKCLIKKLVFTLRPLKVYLSFPQFIIAVDHNYFIIITCFRSIISLVYFYRIFSHPRSPCSFLVKAPSVFSSPSPDQVNSCRCVGLFLKVQFLPNLVSVAVFVSEHPNAQKSEESMQTPYPRAST